MIVRAFGILIARRHVIVNDEDERVLGLRLRFLGRRFLAGAAVSGFAEGVGWSDMVSVSADHQGTDKANSRRWRWHKRRENGGGVACRMARKGK